MFGNMTPQMGDNCKFFSDKNQSLDLRKILTFGMYYVCKHDLTILVVATYVEVLPLLCTAVEDLTNFSDKACLKTAIFDSMFSFQIFRCQV